MPMCIRCGVVRNLSSVDGETWYVVCKNNAATMRNSAVMRMFTFTGTRIIPENALVIGGKCIGLCPSCVLNNVPEV